MANTILVNSLTRRCSSALDVLCESFNTVLPEEVDMVVGTYTDMAKENSWKVLKQYDDSTCGELLGRLDDKFFPLAYGLNVIMAEKLVMAYRIYKSYREEISKLNGLSQEVSCQLRNCLANTVREILIALLGYCKGMCGHVSYTKLTNIAEHTLEDIETYSAREQLEALSNGGFLELSLRDRIEEVVRITDNVSSGVFSVAFRYYNDTLAYNAILHHLKGINLELDNHHRLYCTVADSATGVTKLDAEIVRDCLEAKASK